MQDYSNKRFLVVDDFSDFRTSMKSMLRDIGAKDVDTLVVSWPVDFLPS